MHVFKSRQIPTLQQIIRIYTTIFVVYKAIQLGFLVHCVPPFSSGHGPSNHNKHSISTTIMATNSKAP